MERIHGTCSSSDLRLQPSRCQCRCQICLHFPASIIFAQAADVSARTSHPMDSSLSFNRCTTHCSCPLLRLEVIDFESYTSGTNVPITAVYQQNRLSDFAVDPEIASASLSGINVASMNLCSNARAPECGNKRLNKYKSRLLKFTLRRA